MTALDVKNIEDQITKAYALAGIKGFARSLRPIRSGIITLKGKEYIAEAKVPKDIHKLLQKLQSGY